MARRVPVDPAAGKVWTSMAWHIDDGSYEDDRVSIGEVSRAGSLR